MKQEIIKKLIEEIESLSQEKDNELYSKIEAFIEIYYKQLTLNQKLEKENKFFIKKMG